MASRRVIMKTKLKEAIGHCDVVLTDLQEVHYAFSQYGEHYQKYLELMDGIAQTQLLVKSMLEKLNEHI